MHDHQVLSRAATQKAPVLDVCERELSPPNTLSIGVARIHPVLQVEWATSGHKVLDLLPRRTIVGNGCTCCPLRVVPNALGQIDDLYLILTGAPVKHAPCAVDRVVATASVNSIDPTEPTQRVVPSKPIDQIVSGGAWQRIRPFPCIAGMSGSGGEGSWATGSCARVRERPVPDGDQVVVVGVAGNAHQFQRFHLVGGGGHVRNSGAGQDSITRRESANDKVAADLLKSRLGWIRAHCKHSQTVCP